MRRNDVRLPNGSFITILENGDDIDVDFVDKERHFFDRIVMRRGILLFLDARSREEIDTVIAHMSEVVERLPPAVQKALQECRKPPSA